jgi:hypothetical protein
MGFTFVADEKGRSRVKLENEPNYIIPLQTAPQYLENNLKQGKWLVVCMSVWNLNDMRAGHRAIEIVKRHRGLVQLGLRPFDDPEENLTWISDVPGGQQPKQVEILLAEHDNKREVIIRATETASPVWVALSDGKVAAIKYGLLSDDEIERLIIQLLQL